MLGSLAVVSRLHEASCASSLYCEDERRRVAVIANQFSNLELHLMRFSLVRFRNMGEKAIAGGIKRGEVLYALGILKPLALYI